MLTQHFESLSLCDEILVRYYGDYSQSESKRFDLAKRRSVDEHQWIYAHALTRHSFQLYYYRWIQSEWQIPKL